ncbi:MAG: squalene/phytoene synthase family protein [Phenylobacterium sp.]|uniref:squalene/phytoene synthase family protein n=1 Tax=Phenylobacterium sp. TaxID=1871053 RepID=UPI001A2DD7A4|nr:squalene/phytoene synthase family protein [Phenylobacterium sp.]MBJ7409080.1 squalene/phytoene synthase family protein [Phenylobacterium sp.]
MSDDLDDLIRRVDPDRWLSSRFVADAALSADVLAIYAYDHEVARAPKVASNPILGEIRLTWWREMLDEAYEGRPVRHHPTAQALAAAIARRHLPREPLEAMIDARYRELDATPMEPKEALAWARDTGGRAAELAAMILAPGEDSGPARAGGAAWALALRAAEAPALAAISRKTMEGARKAVRALAAPAFPAVAHAALAGRRRAPLSDRLRVVFAVARGRI